jgi:hypothetical protein
VISGMWRAIRRDWHNSPICCGDKRLAFFTRTAGVLNPDN